MNEDMLPVPPELEDIEVGDEITFPGRVQRWTVRVVGTESVRGDSGAARTVWHLTLKAVNGDERHHTGERLDMVARWVPLDDIAEAFRWKVGDPEDRNDAPLVIPTLIARVRELAARAEFAEGASR